MESSAQASSDLLELDAALGKGLSQLGQPRESKTWCSTWMNDENYDKKLATNQLAKVVRNLGTSTSQPCVTWRSKIWGQ